MATAAVELLEQNYRTSKRNVRVLIYVRRRFQNQGSIIVEEEECKMIGRAQSWHQYNNHGTTRMSPASWSTHEPDSNSSRMLPFTRWTLRAARYSRMAKNQPSGKSSLRLRPCATLNWTLRRQVSDERQCKAARPATHEAIRIGSSRRPKLAQLRGDFSTIGPKVWSRWLPAAQSPSPLLRP